MQNLKTWYKIVFILVSLAACTSEKKQLRKDIAASNDTVLEKESLSLKSPEMGNRSFTFSPSNSTVSVLNKNNRLDYAELIKTYLPIAQHFSVFSENDTIIRGQRGSLLSLASNSLIHSDGKDVAGAIDIQLTEYTKPSEFAAANLVTRTTDGDLLETVGMLNIVATQGGDTLKLKEGEEATIAFPLKSQKANFKVWDAKTNADGLVEWSLQKNTEFNSPLLAKKLIPVHMKPAVGDDKNNFAILQTCSGGGWQTYFNSRFNFAAGEGEELLDEKNFLAYSFKVNKSGKVVDLFVDEKGLPDHIINLSRKYEWHVQSFISGHYPKLNLCRLPDYKKRVFRFKILPGNTVEPLDLITLNETEGGYTVEELKELYENTGEEVYLNSYLQKLGTKSNGKIPTTRVKRSSKLLNGFLTVTGEVGRTVLSVASLGLINGDCVASMGGDLKYKKGVQLKAVILGAGSAVYMVFKRMGSFIKGSVSADGSFTFGERIPKGEPVVFIATSENMDGRFMARLDYNTADETIEIKPDKTFEFKQFQNWLDNPNMP